MMLGRSIGNVVTDSLGQVPMSRYALRPSTPFFPLGPFHHIKNVEKDSSKGPPDLY